MTTKRLMSPNCRCMVCKWVFKIKHNGVYQTNLVTCRSVNFFENLSPVVSDTMFGVLLLIMIEFGFLSKVFDVKTAFLFGKLEEELLECPLSTKATESIK